MLNALVQDFSMQLNLRRSFSIELPRRVSMSWWLIRFVNTIMYSAIKFRNTKSNANRQIIYPRTVIPAKYVNGFLVRNGRVLGPPRADKLGALGHFPPTVDGFEWTEVES